jgi:hypothetical protein
MSAIFQWQKYENYHVYNNDDDDSTVVEDLKTIRSRKRRVVVKRINNNMKDDNKINPALETWGRGLNDNILNKALSYQSHYWDSANEALLTSSYNHQHEHNHDDVNYGGEDRESGAAIEEKKKNARDEFIYSWPNTSAVAYVAVVGENIYLRLFDENNENECERHQEQKFIDEKRAKERKKRNYDKALGKKVDDDEGKYFNIVDRMIIKSVRMYGQFGLAIVKSEDFLQNGSICKFSKEVLENQIDSFALSNLFFQLEYDSVAKNMTIYSAPRPCLLCFERNHAQQFHSFLLEQTLFGKTFKNRIDRMCSRCGLVKDVGTIFTLHHTGMLYGELGGHSLSEFVQKLSNDETFSSLCANILSEIHAIQYDVISWSQEVRKEDNLTLKQWFSSLNNQNDPKNMTEFQRIVLYILKSKGAKLFCFIFRPIVSVFLFPILWALPLSPLTKGTDKSAAREISDGLLDELEAFNHYRGYISSLVLDKSRSRGLSVWCVMHVLFTIKYVTLHPREIVSRFGILKRIIPSFAYVFSTWSVHMIRLYYQRDFSIFAMLSGRKQNSFDRYKRLWFIGSLTILLASFFHGLAMRYMRYSIQTACSQQSSSKVYRKISTSEVCNDMLTNQFRLECVLLLCLLSGTATHFSVPMIGWKYPVIGPIAVFVCRYSPDYYYSIFPNIAYESRLQNDFEFYVQNLFGYLIALCCGLSIVTTLNMQAHFKRQSLDWFLKSYLFQRKGRKALSSSLKAR